MWRNTQGFSAIRYWKAVQTKSLPIALKRETSILCWHLDSIHSYSIQSEICTLISVFIYSFASIVLVTHPNSKENVIHRDKHTHEHKNKHILPTSRVYSVFLRIARKNAENKKDDTQFFFKCKQYVSNVRYHICSSVCFGLEDSKETCKISVCIMSHTLDTINLFDTSTSSMPLQHDWMLLHLHSHCYF